MLNQVVCVGRMVELSNETLEIVMPRPFKNENGEYDNDYVKFVVSGALLDNLKTYCYKGDVVGVKARIESKEDKSIQLIAEKVTFLSSTKKEDNNEDSNTNRTENKEE